MGGRGGYLLTGVAKNNQTVVTWHCEVVVVLWCAVVIVGGQRALWVVVAMGECGDAVLVGIIDDGG